MFHGRILTPFHYIKDNEFGKRNEKSYFNKVIYCSTECLCNTNYYILVFMVHSGQYFVVSGVWFTFSKTFCFWFLFLLKFGIYSFTHPLSNNLFRKICCLWEIPLIQNWVGEWLRRNFWDHFKDKKFPLLGIKEER